MYESILVPADGSQEMEAIVEQAIELASLCDATIHALHVVDERAYMSVPDDARDMVRETLEDDAKVATEGVVSEAEEVGVDVERELRWGDPAAGILSYAVEADIAAIVMGTHGRTGYERYVMGSVAEKVVRLSPVPVLVVDVGETDEKRKEILDSDGAQTILTEPPSNGDERAEK
jgi:nucleotide-binding universal stress UspA family protein